MRTIQNNRLPQASHNSRTNASQQGKVGCLGIFGLLLLTIIVTVAATAWAIESQFFTRNFKPVELSDNEQLTLEQKLDALTNTTASTENLLTPSVNTDISTESSADEIARQINVNEFAVNDVNPDTQRSVDGEIQPERYTEDNSKRRIELTERELNALLAKNTDLAEQLVVDLTDNLASIKILVDLDPDFPFLGGKTLKVSGGTELSYQNNRPVVVMKGVSVWGVPIPNAWLGGLKNIDLVNEFGGTDGFWKSLADGIEDIRVQDSKLLIQLAE